MSKYSSENISRIGNAVIYISGHTSDLSKTKLLKLLYLMEERSAMLPCAADYYREALAIHNASNAYNADNV